MVNCLFYLLQEEIVDESDTEIIIMFSDSKSTFDIVSYELQFYIIRGFTNRPNNVCIIVTFLHSIKLILGNCTYIGQRSSWVSVLHVVFMVKSNVVKIGKYCDLYIIFCKS